MFRQHPVGMLLIFAVCLGVAGCSEPAAKLEPVDFTNPLREPDFTLAQMHKIVEFSDAEKPRVETAFQARGVAFAEWDNLRGKEVRETEAKLAKAITDGDETLRRSFEVRLRPALEARRNVMLEHETLILAAMSEESVERWHAHLVVEKLQQLAEPLRLTSGQQQQLQDGAREAVNEFPSGEERLSGAFFRLEKRLESEVLTAQQLEEYQRIKQANSRRGVTW